MLSTAAMLRRLSLAAALVALGIALLVPLAALVVLQPPWTALSETFSDPYLWRVLGFTAWQALLSTLVSVGLGVPVARALARRPGLPGRRLLLALLSLPVVMPAIVAVFGIIAVFGYQGWMNRTLVWLGLPRWEGLYGLPGILLVHTFFNLPLCVRLLLPVWQQQPSEYWRLAAQLGMSGGALWRLIEWPLLRAQLPGVCALVAMLCAASFAVVLALGGGPAATTLPVAIYESLRFEVDLPRAALLALLQLAIGVVLLGLLPRPGQALWLARPGTLQSVARADAARPSARLLDALWLGLAAILLLAPSAALLIEGLRGPLWRVLGSVELLNALRGSLAIAALSVLVALAIGLPLAAALARRPRRAAARGLGIAAQLGLAVSPLALGTGWFLLVRGDPGTWGGVGLIALVNGVMGVPYLLRLLLPALARIEGDYARLMGQLDIRGWTRLRRVTWPLARAPLGSAVALVACMSLGDLGVVALFGDQRLSTLPLLLYRQLGTYRSDEAAVTALALLVLIGVLFWSLDRLIGGKERQT